MFDENGHLMEDQSAVPDIPTKVQSAVVKNGKIYCLSKEEEEDKVWSFDGVQWRLVVVPSLLDLLELGLKLKMI